MSDVADWHRLLLALAGRLPDQVITESRAWLAAGRTATVAQAVVSAALAHHVAITDDEVAQLAAALGEGTREALEPVTAGRDVLGVAPPYGMAPAGADVLAEHEEDIPFRMDLSARTDVPGGPDAVDSAAVAWCTADEHTVALWRSWRYPAEGTPSGPVRRLYLVQVTAEAALSTVTAGLQATLETCGERAPQVESFVEESRLPAYQSRALSYSALLWAATPAEEPGIAPGAVTADPDLADRVWVAAYLDAGRPLTVMKDSLGERAERAHRTDGTWIWPVTAGDDVRESRQDPAGPLLAHIRDRFYQPSAVDAVAAHRALCVLYRPVAASRAGQATSRRRIGRRRSVLVVAALIIIGGTGAAGAAAEYGSPPAAERPRGVLESIPAPATTPTGTGAPVPAAGTAPASGPAAPRTSSSAPARRKPAPAPASKSGSASARPRTAATPAGQTRLITATSVLKVGQSWSTDRLRLALTGDGNVVLHDRGRPVWRSGTAGRNARDLVFQADGNLVLYAHDNSTVWSSGTPGNDGATLKLGGDGNLSITKPGRVLWQTGTRS
ncbi:hypothetical protein [Paractinoplanes hotanensis]|uniref:Bulb-type lectin domain-containing protein n=1 Tax=Paractinoplanes hotanensis TaxID=2906497 RepID=A0ABT0YBN7_9ACTN|nr:hypothetical protein [Actinoplanes hotanensis]MCM4083457.1 hypothetical protein [Actinoplanes hotanensis]